MTSSTTRNLSAFAAAALLGAAVALPAFAAGPVTVTLNGNTLSLNPAPTERAGRVFVPLRGVFENLGASVVYQGGVINATGRGHTVALKIGSQQATVDGQQQTVDVAPFIIGASTYVPLRFVSQALGATVNYDGANRIVALSTNGAPPQAAQAPSNQTITPVPNANGPFGTITLASTLPARGGNVTVRRPAIEAVFAGGTVDPNTVKVYLDQLDVTNDTTRSPRGFTYAPRSPLQPGEHVVRVTGTDTNGGRFSRGWRFTSGTSTASVGQITNVSPANGATVPNQFVITGHTSPGARVTVQIGTQSSGGTTVGAIIGALLGAGGNPTNNSASSTVIADGNGNFSTQFSTNSPSGTTLTMSISATDPNTGAIATPVQETLTVR